MKTPVSYECQEYLAGKYPKTVEKTNLFINGALCPDQSLVKAISHLADGEQLTDANGRLLAAVSDEESHKNIKGDTGKTYQGLFTLIERPWHIFKKNAAQLKTDFELVTKGRKSATIADTHTVVYNIENIFVEEGANIKAAVLDATTGPIYIGQNAHVPPGALINGSFALCEGSYLSLGAKMKGDTTVGPYCKVGGEVSNSVIFGYSNKGHDGFLGNSVLGHWCNLGADTNNSNLKNNYASIKLWDYSTNSFINTGETFCGLIMGDHSKSGINTMFNTGTVVGVSANVFGSGFPRNFIPSFSWGGALGFRTYLMDKAGDVAERVMRRREKVFDEKEADILKAVFEQTKQYRNWENE